MRYIFFLILQFLTLEQPFLIFLYVKLGIYSIWKLLIPYVYLRKLIKNELIPIYILNDYKKYFMFHNLFLNCIYHWDDLTSKPKFFYPYNFYPHIKYSNMFYIKITYLFLVCNLTLQFQLLFQSSFIYCYKHNFIHLQLHNVKVN